MILTDLGLLSLSAGALSGWLVAASIERPQLLTRLGLSARRIRQTHLDWIMMGTILLAVAAAVPHRPNWITALLAFGTIVNPLLFLVLARNEKASETMPFRVITVISFLSLSVGFPALAIDRIAG